MARQSAPAPRLHVSAGQWPDGELDGPAAVLYAAAIARRLKAALAKRPGVSIRQFARESGLSHTTIRALLAGDTYPDTKTLAALERTLDLPLLPDWEERRRAG